MEKMVTAEKPARSLVEIAKTWSALAGAVVMLVAVANWLDIRPVLSRELKEVWTGIDGVRKSLHFLNYQIYNERQKTEVLTVQEQTEYCTITEILKLTAQGCR